MYQFTILLDSVGRTATDSSDVIPVMLYGAWENQKYVPVDTVYFYGLASDTTIAIESKSTGTWYPWLKLGIEAGDSLTVLVDKVYATFLDK